MIHLRLSLSFTGSGPEMTIFIDFRRVFRPYSTNTTCLSWYLVTHISDTLVMVINCQKKFEHRVEKNATVNGYLNSGGVQTI